MPVTLTLQNVMYIAINLQDILYGVELILYFETIHAVLTVRKKWERSEVSHALFSTVMLILITIWVSTCALFGEEMWVIHTDHPGVGDTYWFASVTSWYLNMGRAAVFILQLMTDALLIHRCRAIWSTYAVIVPSIIWVAALVLGVLQTWICSSPAGNILSSIAPQMGLAYYATCVFLNMMLTAMICCRIIRHGRLVQAELGREYSLGYFSVAEIIVESALPFTLSGIAFLVTLGLYSQVMIPFCWVYYMATMLILRVLSRKKFDPSTSELTPEPSNISFRVLSQARSSDGLEGTLRSRSSSKVHSGGDPEYSL